MIPRTPPSTLFPYTTLFRSAAIHDDLGTTGNDVNDFRQHFDAASCTIELPTPMIGDIYGACAMFDGKPGIDRKSTRLNSSHLGISYAVFCLKKKTKEYEDQN